MRNPVSTLAAGSQPFKVNRRRLGRIWPGVSSVVRELAALPKPQSVMPHLIAIPAQAAAVWAPLPC